MKSGAAALGTYFYFEKGRQSMAELLSTYPQCSADNFSLPWFMSEIQESGFDLAWHKVCGFTTDSGQNLGFSFHHKGERMYLMSYLARLP